MSQSTTSYLSVISAVTVLVSVCVGPVVTLYVSERQLTAAKEELRTTFFADVARHRVSDLRNELALYFQKVSEFDRRIKDEGYTPSMKQVLADLEIRQNNILLVLGRKDQDLQIAMLELKTIVLQIMVDKKEGRASAALRQLGDKQKAALKVAQDAMRREYEKVEF